MPPPSNWADQVGFKAGSSITPRCDGPCFGAPPPAGGLTTFTWDYENKPTKVVLSTGAVATMMYNGDGQRVQKHDSDGTSKFLMIRQPVVGPQFETKPILEIIKGLAAALDKRHQFETPLTQVFNFTMENFIDAQLKGQPVDRATLLREGIWIAPEEPFMGDYRNGKKKFNTPSGKVEFVSERFHRNGYPALPEYVPPRTEPGKQRLITGHVAWYTHASNQNNAWLHSLYPENTVWIHPDVAREKGIQSGDTVRVQSRVGEVRIKALVTKKIRRDTVFIAHGFGTTSRLQHLAYGKGGADQVLMESSADVITGNQAMHETFVEIEKA